MDHRSRSVPNRYWMTSAACGTPILAAAFILQPTSSVPWLFSFLTTAIIAAVLYFGKVFGGADAKGLMLLAFLWPPDHYAALGGAHIHPVLDVAVPAILASGVSARLTRARGAPFFVWLWPLVAVQYWTGGIFWWPFLWTGEWLAGLASGQPG